MTTTAYTIRDERLADHQAVAAMQAEAFEDADVIPRLISAIREQTGPLLGASLVAASDQDQIIGHVMLSQAWVDGAKHLIDVLVLSPLGVAPARQGQGIGTALITAALDRANTLGAPLLFLEGNPRYYGKRGFDKAGDLGFRRPSLRIPEGAFQVARLDSYTEDMTGTFIYRDVHWTHGVGLYRDN